ncbi:unnamed protein product [Durusdinium trenchii]|uniref:Uncharacterized protein n=1 Tax=Durusdinium trenchii TaxID=1381693 RepID=A0ABP0PHW0_9DINO
MAHFTKQERFERLLAFRKEWDDLHKLDQDQVAPQFIYWAFERIRGILRKHGQEGGDDSAPVSKTRWQLLGRTVCIGAWKRTKQYMSDAHYNLTLVYFPYEVARVRLPLGLPQGVVANKEIPDDFKQQLLKALPAMQKYRLDAAASYLEKWLTGTLELEPLLDVSAFLDGV